MPRLPLAPLTRLTCRAMIITMKWQEWTAVADDPSLWKNREEKGLLKAEHIRDYVLRLWFEDEMDVSIYELDFHPLVVEDNPGDVFAPLNDEERFKQIRGIRVNLAEPPNGRVR